MAYRDLQEFIAKLDEQKLLKRVTTEVSQDLEIAEICDRVVKARGPALLFERVNGHSIPVAINLFGSEERMSLALGVRNLDQLSEKLAAFLSFAMNPPTGNFIDKLKTLPRLLEAANFLPKSASRGVCQEVVKKEDADLLSLPIIKCWPKDGGRYITFPLVFTKDPQTGKRNCGVYRMQVYDGKTTGMHFHPHKDGARHLRKTGERMEIACAIGCEPSICFAAAMPLPPDVDEMFFAGIVREEGVKMVKAVTVDVEVPAEAEIVVEGYVDVNEKRVEGPFGDHTGYYSLEDEFPVFHVTAITHRRNPVYHTIIVGPPPMEDCYVGKAIERLFLPLMKLTIPELVDYHMPYEGVFHNLMIVAINKQYPGHARKVMHAIWGLGQAMFTKAIIVVDRDVDVHNMREVAWKALNHIDPERDIEFAHGPVDILDHSSPLPGYGSKMGIDATTKWKGEGFERRWPEEITMSAEIKAIVDRKWNQLGIK